MSASKIIGNLGRAVAFHPALVKPLGSINSVLFFEQIMYWQPKADHPDGVYKTCEDIEAETGLSYREQVTARKHLVSIGVLVETHRRLEHRMYFKIDLAAFDRIWSELQFPNDDSAIRETTNAQSVELTNPQFVPLQKNTQENTDKKNACALVSVAQLEADGLPGDLAAEWLAHRKRQRAALTPRAWAGLKKQAAAADKTPAEAVQMALERGWRGFEAGWMVDKNKPAPAAYQIPTRSSSELYE